MNSIIFDDVVYHAMNIGELTLLNKQRDLDEQETNSLAHHRLKLDVLKDRAVVELSTMEYERIRSCEQAWYACYDALQMHDHHGLPDETGVDHAVRRIKELLRASESRNPCQEQRQPQAD